MILITGSSGFIGSRMLLYLNSMGIEDIILCDFQERSYRYNNKAKYFKSYDVLDGDLFNQEITSVFHFGAISDTLETNIDLIQKYNIDFTKKLSDFCRTKKLPLFFASTAAIYGNGSGPLNLYAMSKLVSEKDISDHAVCFRLFNVYGPNEYHKRDMASVMFKWFNQLKDGERLHIFENSHTYNRDFIYVDDVCRAFFNAYRNPIPGVYDLGSGIQSSFDDVADKCIAAFGSGSKIEIAMPEKLKKQYQTNTMADIGKAVDNGWIDTTETLASGINHYYEKLKNETKNS